MKMIRNAEIHKFNLPDLLNTSFYHNKAPNYRSNVTITYLIDNHIT